MSDRYDEKADREMHDKLNISLIKISGDIGYIKGQIDTLVDNRKDERQNNSDWWSRIGCMIACAIAYFKGA